MTAPTERLTGLTGPERETIVNSDDDAEVVTIWTARRKDITRLRRNPSFTEVESGYHGSTEWARFTIPTDSWNPASGAKRRVSLTPEQRRAAADRLRAARAASLTAGRGGCGIRRGHVHARGLVRTAVVHVSAVLCRLNFHRNRVTLFGDGLGWLRCTRCGRWA